MAKAVFGSRASESRGAPYGSHARTFQTAEDIIPIAELRANMSEIVRGLDDRPRPLVVTLNGKPAAVVMSPREYDLLSYQSRFVDAVAEGLEDVAADRVRDGEPVIDEMITVLATKRPRARRAR